MSRGHGRVQQQILAALAREQPLTTFQLAARIYEGPVDPADGMMLLTDAQLVAVRRALLQLQREGRVTGTGRDGYRDGRQRWFIKGSEPEQAELAYRNPRTNTDGSW